MANWFIKKIVRFKFSQMSRVKADYVIHQATMNYRQLLLDFDALAGRQKQVPKMLGVDEDMRGWSYYMILEHNLLVNQRILNVQKEIIEGIIDEADEQFNPKKDVMPTVLLGNKIIDPFFESIDHYVDYMSAHKQPSLENTKDHPIFGVFTAHQWHCMFGFHLELHVKQAKALLKEIKKK